MADSCFDNIFLKILSLLGALLHFAYTSTSEMRLLPGFLLPSSSRHCIVLQAGTNLIEWHIAFYLLATVQPSTSLPWLPDPVVHGGTFLLCWFPRHCNVRRNLHECLEHWLGVPFQLKEDRWLYSINAGQSSLGFELIASEERKKMRTKLWSGIVITLLTDWVTASAAPVAAVLPNHQSEVAVHGVACLQQLPSNSFRHLLTVIINTLRARRMHNPPLGGSSISSISWYL
jgi:hypothetical protein